MGVGVGERRQDHAASTVDDGQSGRRRPRGDVAADDDDVDRFPTRLTWPWPDIP